MGTWASVFGSVARQFPTEEQTTEGAAQPTSAPSVTQKTAQPAQPNPALSADVLRGVSGGGIFTSGAVTYQPVMTFTGASRESESGSPELDSILSYNTADANQVGKSFRVYDKSGAYQRDGQFQEVNNGRDFMQALAGAAAIYGLGGMMSAASGGAGGLAGETLSKAALDGTSAFGANSVPGAFELGTAGTGASGVGSGLGSGVGDVGFGNFADIPGRTGAFATEAGAASAPLPMGQGGWAAATAPAAGSVPATGMMFDPTAGVSAGTGSTWRSIVDGATSVADNPLTKLGVQTALMTSGGVGASGELTPEEKAALYRNRQIGNLTTSWRR